MSKFVFLTCLNERRLFELLCVTSWQPESKFPFSQVRLPSQRVEGARPEFTEGQEAEVYSCSQTGEECGWWKVIIKVNTILTLNAAPLCKFAKKWNAASFLLDLNIDKNATILVFYQR
jgi:hypothetical protein